MKNKAISDYKKLKSAAIFCPKCGSAGAVKSHRSFFEKFLCSLTSDRVAYRKYYCSLCDSYSLLSKFEVLGTVKSYETATNRNELSGS